MFAGCSFLSVRKGGVTGVLTVLLIRSLIWLPVFMGQKVVSCTFLFFDIDVGLAIDFGCSGIFVLFYSALSCFIRSTLMFYVSFWV